MSVLVLCRMPRRGLKRSKVSECARGNIRARVALETHERSGRCDCPAWEDHRAGCPLAVFKEEASADLVVEQSDIKGKEYISDASREGRRSRPAGTDAKTGCPGEGTESGARSTRDWESERSRTKQGEKEPRLPTGWKCTRTQEQSCDSTPSRKIGDREIKPDFSGRRSGPGTRQP